MQRAVQRGLAAQVFILRRALSTRIVRPPAAALAFLTLLPLGRLELDERDVARGALLFPVVGALVGAAVALVGIGLEDTLTPFIAAGIAVAFEALVTGGIHLDAVADASDGLGARTRARALEIMGEGPIGAFGATSLIVDLLLKTGAIAVLLAADDILVVLAAAMALGRAAPLVLAWTLPYARSGEGSGRILTDRTSRWRLGGGLALALALAAALLGLRAVALLAGAAVPTLLVAVTARRRLGGVTGDVVGAGIELATTGSLLAAVATV
jgi:adenosylcobinamide-GDP ribazoletransferase